MRGFRLAVAGKARRGRRSKAAPLVLAAVVLGMTGASAQATASTSGDQLYAFGSNPFGQLGNTTNNGTGNPNPSPELVSLPGASGSVVQGALGNTYSLALTSTGQLYAFGGNSEGQLGNAINNTTSSPNPTPTPVSLPGMTGAVTQISAGAAFSLAGTSSGQLYAFGRNDFGQLGSATNNGTNNPNPTPTLVNLPGASGPVAEIAAGGDHTLVLTTANQLYAFGWNYYGQLGRAANNGVNVANPTPTLVGLPGATGAVTQIAAGAFHSLVLTSTGQLYAFGENLFGELGNPTNSGTEKPTPTPTLVSLPGATGPVTQIAASASFSLAATSTGQLYAFGRNRVGELGNTTNIGTDNPNSTPTLVSLPGATGPITRLAAGLNHSLAATSTGQLYGFGSNTSGQLGSAINSGTSAANPTPILAALPPGLAIDGLAQGEAANHTMVLLAEPPVTSLPIGSSPIAPPPPRGALPPAVTAGRMSNTRFRVAKRDTAVSAKRAPLGTIFRFNLSTAANVQIVITRAAAGLRHGRLCLAATPKLRLAHSKRCTRTLIVGKLTRSNMPTGADRIPFSGRIGASALRPKHYQAQLTASNAGGRSAPLMLSFTVVR
jgi:alpha-tubulin suppressor-like RCC1 family protein